MMNTRETLYKNVVARARAYSYPRKTARRYRGFDANRASPLPTRRVASRHVSSSSSAPGGGGAAKTSDALVPPNPKLLDIAARIPSLFVFTIGA